MGFSPDWELWTVTQITKCCDPALYANVPTFLFQAAILCLMADSETPPAKLSDIIDYIEKVREELLTIQRSLEKLESAESAAPERRRISK